jgi:hypothetical protein
LASDRITPTCQSAFHPSYSGYGRGFVKNSQQTTHPTSKLNGSGRGMLQTLRRNSAMERQEYSMHYAEMGIFDMLHALGWSNDASIAEFRHSSTIETG